MGWMILLVLVVGGVAFYLRASSSKPPRAVPTTRAMSSGALASEEAQVLREIEVLAAEMQTDIDNEAARIHADAMREAEKAVAGSRSETADVPRRGIWREDYVPKENEEAYLIRNAHGRPHLFLVDAGDRLAIWSPLEGGALINPKGPGIRAMGLYASYARGASHHRDAYRAADLNKGRWVDLKRESDNPHDKNAVAMCAPGSRVGFAYVQRGRAPAVARRMDAGEDMAGVVMRGPGRGSDDDTTVVLLGCRADLTAMLSA